MEPEKAHIASQTRLIDLLNSDLDLCFTMLETAGLASSVEHRRDARRRVSDALKTIRDLIGRVENRESFTSISARADQVEAALHSG